MEEENRPDNCPPCPVCEERLKNEGEEMKNGEEKKKENVGFFGRLFGATNKAEEGLKETQDNAVEAVKAQGENAKANLIGFKDKALALVGQEPTPAIEKSPDGPIPPQAEETQVGGKKHRRKHKKTTKKHHKSNLKKGTKRAKQSKSKKTKHTKKVRFAKRNRLE